MAYLLEAGHDVLVAHPQFGVATVDVLQYDLGQLVIEEPVDGRGGVVDFRVGNDTRE